MAHDRAKAKAKRFFGGRCVFSGRAGVDGAHIFSAGDFPELADCCFNIVPMWRKLHSENRPCFDTREIEGTAMLDPTEKRLVYLVRPVSERLWILRTFVLDELRPLLHKWLRQLEAECIARKIDFPQPEVPTDEKILRDMQNSERANNLASGRLSAVGLVQENF